MLKKYLERIIVFTKEFKERAINLYNQGHSTTTLFELNGMSVRPEGFNRKSNSSKWERSKISFETKEEELEYYKELITKLKQEIEFLKKVKALRE